MNEKRIDDKLFLKSVLKMTVTLNITMLKLECKI